MLGVESIVSKDLKSWTHPGGEDQGEDCVMYDDNMFAFVQYVSAVSGSCPSPFAPRPGSTLLYVAPRGKTTNYFPPNKNKEFSLAPFTDSICLRKIRVPLATKDSTYSTHTFRNPFVATPDFVLLY
jgi:hypothetical protein